MPVEQFKSHKFSDEKRALIRQMIAVLNAYAAQGYRLTLRQLYYQLVSKALIPNTLQSYKNIGELLSNARLAGLVDWSMIEDRNRETITPSHWESPSHILRAVAEQYRIDKWADQPYHIEVMVEKDALSGVLVPVTRRLDISLTANKGYSSQSTMYEIGKRLARLRKAGKQITIIYLGDHDPSGIDMTRDVEDRLSMFSRVNGIEILRLALNIEQVRQWNPPENPAKMTDSRIAGYVEKFGYSSWELDAVEPRELDRIVTAAVEERRNQALWDAALEREQGERDALKEMADSWDEDHPVEAPEGWVDETDPNPDWRDEFDDDEESDDE